MGHYAAEMGYQTPAERAQEAQKNLTLAQQELKNNPIPKLRIGDEVSIAVKRYYLLTDSTERIFLEYCDRLISYAKVIKGIKVLEIRTKNKRTYVRLGKRMHCDLWYDAQLFKKVE